MRGYNARDWIDRPIDEVIREKENEGYIVYQGNEFQLLLDLDTGDAIAQYQDRLPLARRLFNVTVREEWLSKSGGLHVLLECPEALSPEARLLIQACLGSDPVREMLGLMRIMRQGIQNPSLLFRPLGTKFHKYSIDGKDVLDERTH